ncbi:electron transfer flavoprotein alpha subunit apoprotein [Paracoccus aminovorans]|uniref:Electron transfer flavoprotein alpha subunit apoprotein n=1 Tax=Paracoccus aminovorans TaxID=34004 RepID=A0A1I2ZQX1_9RHOB|nr:electron transfer flavoprotein subunit alpha/FixB family protein [Paracoccus aminovorans]CQR84135.1 Electron transfer flavoprotein subunit alpha [Paracoccus aminovorans]SFH40144.1 electron transfer flavoprotein alpha subunit apoprotein [Paracoccus aminovorans]
MGEIIVIATQRDGELRPSSLEAITAARGVKQAGDSLAVVIVAADPQALAGGLSVEGVDEVIAVKASDDFQPDLIEAVAAELVAQRKPSLVLTAHGVDAWSFAPTLAARNGLGFATDVLALRRDGGDLVATRAGYAEKVLMDIDFPGKETVLLTVRTNVFEPASGQGSAKVTDMAAPAADIATTHEGWKPPADAGGIDIPGSEFILSIGRGVADESNVEQFLELADKVGATLGCSRPIADNGWLPKARQVGQSGQLAASCRLYVAMGVSGSVQHQWGMKHVENIVAVNSDPEASIFSIARYGIVGDMFEIASELENHF